MADAGAHGQGSGYQGVGRRVGRIWNGLDANQRLAGAASLALCCSLALPWFTETGIETVRPMIYPPQPATRQAVSVTLSGFDAFSWVEAAVLLVALGTLVMLAARGERRAFHLPGGDGVVIAAAGSWCVFLLAWRVLKNAPSHADLETGVDWGLAVAFGAAALLIFAGLRIRAAHRPEPPLAAATIAIPLDDPPTPRRPAATDGEQLRLDHPDAGEQPTKRQLADQDPTVEQLAMPLDDPKGRRGGKRRRNG